MAKWRVPDFMTVVFHMAIDPHNIAVWVVTPNGLQIAKGILDQWPGAVLMGSQGIGEQIQDLSLQPFSRLADEVARQFNRFRGHLFIMATGIVVRIIAPHLQHKTRDPAVVVLDDGGLFAISLVSGHIGGANALARTVARMVDAVPVITTATDIHQVPAMDLIALEKKLFIENPEAIKQINMAFLEKKEVLLHDPFRLICAELSHLPVKVVQVPTLADARDLSNHFAPVCPGIFIDDAVVSLPARVLVLRPPSLAVGIGCNRHTPGEEILESLHRVLEQNHLSPASLKCIASIDLKSDEAGLRDLAEKLGLSLLFYAKEELGKVKDIPNPSATVKKCIGISSVCEAAALLASRQGKLIVPKQTTPNVTVAIARTPYTSSALGPAT
jgi:cobalt-precorrin 5A hydrolase